MWWNDADNLASTVLACFGGVAMLHLGAGRDGLRRELLRQGVDVLSRESLEAMGEARGRSLIVTRVLDGAAPEQHAQAARDALAARAREAMVLVKLADGQTREHVEQAWLDAGWRRHPRLLRAVTYEGLEMESVEKTATLVVEPVPEAARAAYPLKKLAADRGLRMDMLRVGTRRSDAHLARYALACEQVRRGDRVLDVACGLGYGSRMLRLSSDAASVVGVDSSDFAIEYARANYAGDGVSFAQGDASSLSAIPDASVDVVVSMETLEHLADPAQALQEFARVLTPGGRVVVSVPNQWGDTTGPARNPHHLHEYSWSQLRAQLERHFLPERRWRQTAGGGRKLKGAVRQIASVAWDQEVAEGDHAQPAEWWLAAAMKSPLGATKDNYVETIFRKSPSDNPAFHVAAFAREYDNPWLVRALVGIGDRMSDPRGLSDLARRVRDTARPGSPDQGAAICVLAYQALGGSGGEGALHDALRAIDEFDRQADGSPHAWRWQVSNRFAAARVWLALGDRARARAQFAACAGMDVLKFSPLLATKTVEACLLAGVIDLVDGRQDDARGWWVRGMHEARRVTASDWLNVWGSPEQPLSFGMRELSEVLDAASRCAGWLVQLEHASVRPGLAWTRAAALSHAEQRRWAERLNVARIWLDEQRTAWATLARQREHELLELSRHREGLDADMRGLRTREQDLEAARAWHEQQASSWRTQHEQAMAKLEELVGWAQQLQGASAWHESQSKHWLGQAQFWETQAKEWQAQATAHLSALEQSRQETQRQRDHADAQASELHELRTWAGKLVEAKDWHAQQLSLAQQTIAERDKALEDLQAWTAKLDEARAWHESQSRTILAQRDEHMQALQIARESAARAATEHAHAIEMLEKRLANKDRAIDALIARIESMRTLRGVARTLKGVLFGMPRDPDPQDPANQSPQSR